MTRWGVTVRVPSGIGLTIVVSLSKGVFETITARRSRAWIHRHEGGLGGRSREVDRRSLRHSRALRVDPVKCLKLRLLFTSGSEEVSPARPWSRRGSCKALLWRALSSGGLQ